MKLTPGFYAEYSRYARRLIEADPSLEAEAAVPAPWTAAAMEAFLRAPAPADEQALGAALRRLRQRVMLRTLARDLAGEASLEEVCGAMTALADVALQHGQATIEATLGAEFGVPRGESDDAAQSLIVVGMGKLGGGELNVSSDIDLVFVYPSEGETRGGPRSLSNHEYFTRLGQRLIALVGRPTDAGQVFRVDMRLRPWGDSGPLVASFDALENYLVAHGREWERYAWIKGRAITGTRHGELDAIVRPFVYRKYLDYGTLAAMRELHAEVRAEVARRELADHVKLGPGGIREIEFIAQAFQLIRGGREAELRTRPTLSVLSVLAGKRVITREAEQHLAAAYAFLRKLEHRLQYLDDAQTHSLPEDDGDRERVAAAMGFADWRSFRTVLDEHRDRVSRQFESVFAAPESPRHALFPVWHAPQDPESEARLAEVGFADPSAMASRLAALRTGSRYAELPEASRARIDSLVPDVIQHAARRPHADEALRRCIDLLEAISRRAAYLALLQEHPQALAKVVDLVAASPWAAEYLVQHPIVLDELLDPRALGAPSDWGRFATRLLGQLMDARDDGERQMDLVREAHHGQVFRLLAGDLSGLLTVERLADELTDLADWMLQITLELCWTQMQAQLRERFPQVLAGKPRFAIIGYGKLGGKELGYASDLDIIFLHDTPPELADQAAEVYARLAQRINNWLTRRTAAGVLFDTDLRLRPEGESGLMVSSLEAFRRYQEESAWTWEHQALTRARYCAGDATVGAVFEEERRAVLRLERDPEKLRGDVLDMREQLLAGHPNRSELFDLKHDRGGMIDVEFIVQYLVLAHARAHPELTANDGNLALLKLAADLSLVEHEAAEAVGQAYRTYRRRQHALRLAGERYARVPPEEVASETRATLALWDSVFGRTAKSA